MNQEERIIELETKVAYLENYIHDLSDMIIAQEKKIKGLTQEATEIKKQVTSVLEALPEGERPPHY